MKLNEITTSLTTIMNELAEKLDVAVDKIYPVLYKQTRYNMVMDIFWIILSIVILIIIYKIGRNIIKEKYSWQKHTDGVEEVIFFSISLILGVISILGLICCLNEAVQIIINPDWYIFDKFLKPLIIK